MRARETLLVDDHRVAILSPFRVNHQGLLLRDILDLFTGMLTGYHYI